MAGPEGYEDGRQIGARPYLERVGGDMVGPIAFQVSGAATPHLAGGTGFGPLVLGKAAIATYANADTDVVVGDDFEVKGASWQIGGVRANSVLPLTDSAISITSLHGSGFVAGYNQTVMKGRTSSAASVGDKVYLHAGNRTISGGEPPALGLYGGYNSVDGNKFAAVFVGSPVNLTPANYAALFTDQDDPLFAVFDRENPGSVLDHFLYLQRKRDGGSPETFYSLLASALGPTLIGDPTFSVVANPVYTNAVAMAGAFNAAALQTLSLGVSSAVGQDLKLRAGTGLPVGGGAVAALEAGGTRVRFGVFVGNDTVVHDGYIIIKDDAGTERWLGVVKAGD